MKNKLLSALYCVALAVLILTLSISLPIYLRPFYYAQIRPLGLPEETGYTYEEIRQAFDEVMDYLTLPGKEFGTGVFAHSAEGAAHFADCKLLFSIHLAALALSLLLLIALKLLQQKGHFAPARPFGKPLSFSVACALLLSFAVVSIAVAIDFKAVFTLFHKLFFAGKGNWKFHPARDPIILALPNAFFLNCGILIAASAVLQSFFLVLIALLRPKAQKSP